MSTDASFAAPASSSRSLRDRLNQLSRSRSGRASSVLSEASLLVFFWGSAHASNADVNAALLGVVAALMAGAAIWAWIEQLRGMAVLYTIAAVALFRWSAVAPNLPWHPNPGLGWLFSLTLVFSVIHLVTHVTRPWADRVRAARAARG